jgi:outer membrane lipoprotein SlyB
MMKRQQWHQGVLALAVAGALVLGTTGCTSTPAFQVSEQPAARIGTVESVVQDSVQNVNTTVGTIGGALVGGGLGSLIGGGTGQTVATVVGAVGGAYAGNQMAQRSQTIVWRITVRYDDGSLATIQQTTAPGLRPGDRVRVTSNAIELLR